MVACVIVSGLTFLAALASIAEIALASWVLHYLNKLHDQINFSYNGIEESSSDPVVPFLPQHQNLTFEQPWVLVQSPSIWALPGCEIAAGVIALVLALIVFIHAGKLCFSRRSDVPKSGPWRWVGIVASAFLGLAVTALFVYVFATSDNSTNHTNLALNGPLGAVGYDTTPTWEVWTCAISSLLDQDPTVPAARSEWKNICRLTVRFSLSNFALVC